MANYRPMIGVWEITYACNMRCQHCGSSAGQPLPDELSADEALDLCDDLGEIGLEKITLSGGEPFMRPDWHRIARRLTQNGVTVNVISNGWYIDDALLDQAFANGLVNIGISLDGYGKTHDILRKQGSWDRSTKALSLMKQRGMPTVVCTCVNKKNLGELGLLREKLLELGVQRWQIQIAHSMGNLLDHPELIMTPDKLPELVDFCYETMTNKKLVMDLADDVGYLSAKDEAIRRSWPTKKKSKRTNSCVPCWRGCSAGKFGIGIRANGDISPCLSIRDNSFIEDNIRKTPLKEIWTRPNAFYRLRSMSASQLQGFCQKCPYAAICLGGCTGLKVTFQKHIYENAYCLFRLEMEQATKDAEPIESTAELIRTARNHISKRQLPHALIYVDRVLAINPVHLEALKLGGYIHFMMGDYKASLTCNETCLGLVPDDVYSMKGKGVCLTRLNQVEQGIELLKQAADNTKASFMDPYYDLAVIFMEQNRLDEVRRILDLGCDKSEAFIRQARPLYKKLRQKKAASSEELVQIRKMDA